MILVEYQIQSLTEWESPIYFLFSICLPFMHEGKPYVQVKLNLEQNLITSLWN